MAGPPQPVPISERDVLLQVVQDLGTTYRLDELLARIEPVMRRALACERATLFLYDEQADELASAIATGVGSIRFPATAGIAGQALQTRKAIRVDDAYADPRFNPEIDRQTGFRTRSMLTFPLLGREARPVGVLQALNKTGGPFTDADNRLADALSTLVGLAIERQQLLDAYAVKEQIERDLSIARDIQQRLLPRQTPRAPGFAIAGWNQPADATGGDCFDFFTLAGGKIGFLIADATGHGIGPALIIAQFRAMLRAVAQFCDDIVRIVEQTNRFLCHDLPEERFVTAVVGVLDPAARTICYVSAGHGPMIHFDAAAQDAHLQNATGLPLGIFDDHEYDLAGPITLQPGDIFAVLTDGFAEWTRPDGEQFGLDRTIDTVRNHAAAPPDQLIAALHDAVRQFSPATAQADDLTAIIIKATL